MKENQMHRGMFQSLYKYLPESWIDFIVRGRTRRNYIARVMRWNSEKLTEINQSRLLRIVNNEVNSFAHQVASVSNGKMEVPPAVGFGANFGANLTLDTCDVLTPKAGGDERGIVAEISPLTFYCENCLRVHQFRNSQDYYRSQKCPDCKVDLKQIRQIYFCKCGWASDRHNIFCSNKEHVAKYVKLLDKYNYVCTKCHVKIPMIKKCETCGAMCYPKVALDPTQFFPFSVSLIDLIDKKMEDFINSTDYGPYLTIAYWLGKITLEQLKDVVKNGIIVDESIYKKKYDEMYDALFPLFGENAAPAAEIAAKKACGSSYLDEINWVKSEVIINSKDEISKLAEMILEYYLVLESKETSSLDTAINVAKLLNTSANPQEFKDVARKYGITQTQVCGKIPFVFASYGYTREKTTGENGVQLRAFPEEKKGRKNIYATKLDTEGVIFEFNRKMIVEWLLQNEFILKEEVPDINDEVAVKTWFLNNIRLDLIDTFNNIDASSSKTTYYVYRLIHSLSHLMIRQASDLCGLDKNSLSEYIFPAIPAILIYCQNSQGFNLGALFNLFEAYFDQWLKGANGISKKCIFDPICLDRYKACTGCLFLNEVSCQHFNKDLDRTLVIGWYDKKEKKKYHGFWEMN